MQLEATETNDEQKPSLLHRPSQALVRPLARPKSSPRKYPRQEN